MISIRERPAKLTPARSLGTGHWEGDLVFGMRPSAVATLVDRATRYSMIVALPDGYKADVVARALINHLGQLPAHLRRSLTWDRGREMAEHATITAALETPVFFCSHPWQRGTCENTNRLLRQYLHKNADLRNSPGMTWTSSPPASTIDHVAYSAGLPRQRHWAMPSLSR